MISILKRRETRRIDNRIDCLLPTMLNDYYARFDGNGGVVEISRGYEFQSEKIVPGDRLKLIPEETKAQELKECLERRFISHSL